MNIVKVDAINSTNTLAKELNQNNYQDDFCVSADFQTDGRGQQFSSWKSSRGQNLTFTVVYNHLQLKIKYQFILNALVCLSIYKVLKNYDIKNIFLKWPNDILAENKKICGILIENTLSANMIKTSYVGIGLNVNQENFEGLPNAGSLINITGYKLNRDKLLEDLTNQMKEIPSQLQSLTKTKIINDYKSKLFKFNTSSKFILNDKVIEGKILDVQSDGRLIVSFNEKTTSDFQHKEISQLF